MDTLWGKETRAQGPHPTPPPSSHSQRAQLLPSRSGGAEGTRAGLLASRERLPRRGQTPCSASPWISLHPLDTGSGLRRTWCPGPRNIPGAPKALQPAGLPSPAAITPRLSELTGKLKQEEQDREVACGALQKSQEEAGQKVDHEVARMQVPRRPTPGPGV